MLKINFTNFRHSAARVALVALLVLPFLMQLLPVHAADLVNRSINISSPSVSESVRHTFSFTNPTATTIGSIVFEYCDSPLINVACVAPPGLSVLPANLGAQTGNAGFAIHPNTTVNRLVIGRVPAGSLSVANNYVFNGVMNPSVADTTYFVRISVHASGDGTGGASDQGSVAFVTSGSFNIGAFVPPFLIFCVGVTVDVDCSTTTGSLVTFGVLSAGNTSAATTQFSAATNDFTGYQIYLNGQTMTSGNNVIPALLVQTASAQGTSQFGMNMRLNGAPVVGADITGPGTAAVEPKYDTPDLFAFGDGDVLARVTTSSDFNRYTQSYIVNVNASQNPGVYATTLLYTAMASF